MYRNTEQDNIPLNEVPSNIPPDPHLILFLKGASMECEREDWNQRGGSKKETVLLRNPLLVGQVSSPNIRAPLDAMQLESSVSSDWIFLQTPELWSEVPPHPRSHPRSRFCHLCRLHCLLQKMRRRGACFYNQSSTIILSADEKHRPVPDPAAPGREFPPGDYRHQVS